MKTLIKLTLVASAVALVAACGGGGGGGGSSIDTANNPLAKYAGVYYSCEDNDKTTITLSATGSNSLSIWLVINVYSADNCSGNVLATYKLNSPFVATYKGQMTATMPPITLLPFSDKVDEVTNSASGVTAELTGSGVDGNCVKYSYKTDRGSIDGESCFDLSIDSSTTNGALYLTSNVQYIVLFSRENGVLTSDGIYSKTNTFNTNQLVADASSSSSNATASNINISNFASCLRTGRSHVSCLSR